MLKKFNGLVSLFLTTELVYNSNPEKHVISAFYALDTITIKTSLDALGKSAVELLNAGPGIWKS